MGVYGELIHTPLHMTYTVAQEVFVAIFYVMNFWTQIFLSCFETAAVMVTNTLLSTSEELAHSMPIHYNRVTEHVTGLVPVGVCL